MQLSRRRSLLMLLPLLLTVLGISYVAIHSLQTHSSYGSGSAPKSAVWHKIGPTTIVHSILADPRRDTRLYAATTDGALRSDDGGLTWQARNTGLPAADPQLWCVITFDDGHILAAAADDAHVYLSTDAGDHWQASSDALGSGSVFSLAADPAQPMTLLAGGTGGIWRSSDGGVHWRLVHSTSGSDVSALAWSSTAPGTIYAGLVPGPGQILQSRDGGSTWRDIAAGLDGPEGIMTIVGPQQGRSTVLVGTMGHRIWRLEGGTRAWRFSGSGLPAGQHGASLLLTDGAQYAGTMGAGVYTSQDGQHWAPYGPSLIGNAATVLTLVMYGDSLLAGTADGIYRLPIGK